MGGTRGLASANRRGVTDLRTFTVDEDDDGIRLDRWFKRHVPDVSFNVVSRWARTGQLKLNPGASIRIDNTQPLNRPEARPKQ